uniref:Uncharacterized protein n=1 Tax=Manihot esculenta TaxID=3983 RepID=A0A251J7N5_MANES
MAWYLAYLLAAQVVNICCNFHAFFLVDTRPYPLNAPHASHTRAPDSENISCAHALSP